MPPRYVIVGSIALDWIITATGKIKRMVCGGNSLYAAAGASIWHTPVYIVSKVGFNFPFEYLSIFADNGIDLAGVKTVSLPHNILSGYRYDAHGERIFFNTPREFRDLGLKPESELESYFWNLDWDQLDSPELNATPNDVPINLWQAESFCVCAAPFDVQMEFARDLSERGIPFVLDPGWLLSKDTLHLINNIPVLLPSINDCGSFSSRLIQTTSLDFIKMFGPTVIVVKLGRSGSIVYDKTNSKKHIIPVCPVTVKDPTGAGDAYAGAFSVSWGETGDALESALRATVSASFIVEHFDVRSCLLIDQAEVQNRITELRKRVKTIPLQ